MLWRGVALRLINSKMRYNSDISVMNDCARWCAIDEYGFYSYVDTLNTYGAIEIRTAPSILTDTPKSAVQRLTSTIFQSMFPPQSKWHQLALSSVGNKKIHYSEILIMPIMMP